MRLALLVVIVLAGGTAHAGGTFEFNMGGGAVYVKPESGSLALFPAYVWHGTEPFASDEPRLTVAFDVVPD